MQATIGQWSDYINLNYTGIISHTPETCNCGDPDDMLVPLYFDKGIGTTYINSPVCERCHPVRSKGLRKMSL